MVCAAIPVIDVNVGVSVGIVDVGVAIARVSGACWLI
jgi:hypothetical protein